MIAVVAIIVLLATIIHVNGAVAAQCGMDDVSVSGLTKAGYYQEIIGRYTYSLNVCESVAIVDPTSGQSCRGLCQFDRTLGEMQVLGSWDYPDASWSYINNNRSLGVMATMTNGASCGGKARVTKVVFMCDPNGDERYFLVNENPTCTYTITWRTAKACAQGPAPVVSSSSSASSSSSSTGGGVQPEYKCGIDSVELNHVARSRDYTTGGYTMNVCAPSNVASCQPSGICKLDSGVMYHLGTWRSAVWSYINVSNPSAGIKAAINDGGYCPNGSGQRSVVNVQFQCDPRFSDGDWIVISEFPTCKHNIIWRTSSACHGNGESTDSSGTIAISITGVFLALILLGAVLVVKRCQRAGQCLCPNHRRQYSDLERGQSMTAINPVAPTTTTKNISFGPFSGHVTTTTRVY